MNRLPAIFEGSFLGLQLGTSPIVAIQNGKYYYAILVILVAAVTYFSFKLNKTATVAPEQQGQMKMISNMSVIFITIASISMSAGIELYWIANSGFTVIQNILVKKVKKDAK
jgi:membrane protein insertase Oxa1/YidC/SpoIIIJ